MPSDTLTHLQKEVNGLSRFLDRTDLLCLTGEEREGLRKQLASVSERLRTVREEILCIGLLGGTGVGKSTLMNRLAGSEIASTSHRRPHTDKVLMYAHRNTALPGFVAESQVPLSEFRHEIESVRHLLLCDLPDFDSLIGEHRQTVLEFLQHLDLLVWVASPEKYADKPFYDLLRNAPKAGPNFFFVLNKADQLLSENGRSTGLQQLQKVSGRFLGYIRDALSERGDQDAAVESRTYTVSALKSGQVWNQFPLFQEHIFARRSLKQVSSLKAANLVEEIRSLSEPLKRELAEARRFRTLLDDALEAVHDEEEDWRRTLEGPIAAWIDDQVKPRLISDPAGLRHLLGPGRWIARLALEWNRFVRKDEPSLEPHVPAELAELIKDRLQQLRHRTGTQLLRRSLPERIRQRVDQELDPQTESSRLIEEWQWFVHAALREYRPTASLFFRLRQSAVYALLTGLFLLALGGRQAWTVPLRDPQPAAFLDLLFSLLHTTFSQAGLAALVTLLLLGFLAGFRFFKTYQRLADRQARRYAEAITEQILESWREQRRAITERLKAVRQELDSQMQTLQELIETDMPERSAPET